jgi:hypothetical protein
MKHAWQEHRPEGSHPMAEPSRKCSRCGAVQTLTKTYWWGRIIAHRWLPLAGRCGMGRQ